MDKKIREAVAKELVKVATRLIESGKKVKFKLQSPRGKIVNIVLEDMGKHGAGYIYSDGTSSYIYREHNMTLSKKHHNVARWTTYEILEMK